MEGRTSAYGTLVRRSDGKRSLGRQNINRKIILKWVLKK